MEIHEPRKANFSLCSNISMTTLVEDEITVVYLTCSNHLLPLPEQNKICINVSMIVCSECMADQWQRTII